jgi:hypothetical protein
MIKKCHFFRIILCKSQILQQVNLTKHRVKLIMTEDKNAVHTLITINRYTNSIYAKCICVYMHTCISWLSIYDCFIQWKILLPK